MNRLTQKLDKLRKENKKALVAYLVAGDPDMDSTLEIMHLFVKSGVDIIEVGVPFTDPIAEGPIIQRAHDRAIRKKVSLEDIFTLIEKFRSKDDETPLVLMGYLNSFIFYKNLIIEKGTELLFNDGAYLIINGNLSIQGTEEEKRRVRHYNGRAV